MLKRIVLVIAVLALSLAQFNGTVYAQSPIGQGSITVVNGANVAAFTVEVMKLEVKAVDDKTTVVYATVAAASNTPIISMYFNKDGTGQLTRGVSAVGDNPFGDILGTTTRLTQISNATMTTYYFTVVRADSTLVVGTITVLNSNTVVASIPGRYVAYTQDAPRTGDWKSENTPVSHRLNAKPRSTYGYWAFVNTPTEATIEWSFTPSQSGKYEVKVFIPSLNNSPLHNSTVAPYTVSYAGGSQVVKINQEENFGNEVSLGTFAFDAGQKYIVRLSNKTEETKDLENLCVAADTVTWQLSQ